MSERVSKKRIILGVGYPAWDWKYSEKSTLIDNISFYPNEKMKVPEKWRTACSNELPKIRLVAEIIEKKSNKLKKDK